MSKQQRDAIDAALRAEPFGLDQSTDEHRKSFQAFALRPYPADVAAADVTLGGVGAIELTVAGHAADPTVLYFHGGGYVAGSARTGTHLAAELARRAGGRALSADYRLAPEHPYPAAVQDGLAAYAGLLESGVSPARVLVAGDSAGGGLAVAPLLAARDRGLPQPAAAAVFSPWADISRSGASMRTKDGADPLFSYDAMGWYAGRYLPAGDRSAPLASPVFATLAGLPPLLIQAGSDEVLLDDAVRLAANAGQDAAGGPRRHARLPALLRSTGRSRGGHRRSRAVLQAAPQLAHGEPDRPVRVGLLHIPIVTGSHRAVAWLP